MKPWIRALLASSLLFVAAALWLLASAFPSTWKLIRAEMFLQDATLIEAQTSSVWQVLNQQSLAKQRGVYWLRFSLQAPLNAAPLDQTQGLWLALRAASEVYLDGQLLGRNGVVGRTKAVEVPGRVDWQVALPNLRRIDSGKPAKIELLIRASSQRMSVTFSSADAFAIVGNYADLYAFRTTRWLVAALAYGAILVACLYFVAIRPPIRVSAGNVAKTSDYSGVCLLLLGAVGLLLPGVEAWRFLWGYSYPWHGTRLLLLQLLHTIAALLLPIYLALRFRVNPHRAWILCGLLGVGLLFLLVEGTDPRMWLLQASGLLASVAIMLRAPRDADWLTILVLLISMLVLAVLTLGDYLDGVYFIALAVLMVSLLLAHTRELLAASGRAAQLEVERSKLRAELLKRGIQPHWLLNTLTAMQELIEQQPAHASAMVERLADEFKNLHRLSECTSIALADELTLCQGHLNLRELVHGLSFRWRVDGGSANFELPPGMLHALIENAFTHSGASACARAGFELQIIQTQAGTRASQSIRLSSALASVARRTHLGQGTGSAFIQASLQAAFPNQWQFKQYAEGARWIAHMSWQCAF